MSPRREAVERNAQFAFNRAAELVKTPSGTQATVDHDARRARQRQGERAAESGRADHRQENLSYTDISSPIDGRIGLTAVTLGNLVNAATGVLATIVSDDPIYAEFPVSMRQIADLAAHTRATSPPDRHQGVPHARQRPAI